MIRIARGGSDLLEPPLHGNRGDREPAPQLKTPLGLTVAISREAGARGGSVAKRVGKKLGWQVYTQELLEFLCSNEAARAQVLAEAPESTAAWADSQLQRLRWERIINPDVELGEMPRLILSLAARGGVILVGRGAGYLLPSETTLHVRVVAPLEDRISYMGQYLRHTRETAANYVRDRDEQRAAFLMKTFNRESGDLNDYDMVLNSYLLGEEVCANLILAAIHGKEKLISKDED